MGKITTVFSPLGASNHSQSPRQANDFYATDPAAIDALERIVKLPLKILEPACGAGHLSKRLESFKHEVVSQDLYDHGFGKIGVDFFKRDAMPRGCSCIVTNPPYDKAMDFAIHGLDILPEGGMMCLFLKTVFLEGQSRYTNLYSKYPPTDICQFTKRITCAHGGNFSQIKSSAVAYAWYVWVKGQYHDPVLHWI